MLAGFGGGVRDRALLAEPGKIGKFLGRDGGDSQGDFRAKDSNMGCG